jgi:hypothetical protein
MVLLRLGAETHSNYICKLLTGNMVDATGLEPVTPCV